MANPPAGWHPDPLARHAQRYWDGNQWTEHVADQAGNMSTDPLDGGQAAQQDQQATQQAQSDDAGWGQSTATEQEPSWGSDTTSGDADTSPTWGAETTATDHGTAATDESTPAWGESATSEAEADHAAMLGESMGDAAVADADAGTTDATSAPAWGEGGAAAGAAAAAGSAAEDDEPLASWEPSDRSDDTTVHGDATSAIDQDHRTIARFDVADGIVVRQGHVVASSGDVTLGESPHPGSMAATGTGTLWVGAGGRDITVVDVPSGGLTVRNDALVAHSDGLHRSAASDGIVGFDGTSVSGSGWVAVAAAGGTLEITPTADVDVAVGSLVAWSNDLDVSHAEHVNLAGHGTVLVAAG